ncbi:hypothetical protein GCM10009838_68360 [Catenulispora subtropica]|uniref:Uncharacterized protein n=1 Tax=Catenulispora subtropica TaxID=450798 RepID=A0ABP5EE90_9ACTN
MSTGPITAPAGDDPWAGCVFARLDGPDDECIFCDTRLHYTAGESLVDGENRWFLATRCPGCGNEWLECGRGLPSEPARTILTERTGQWVATVGPETTSATPIMRAFRRIYRDTISEARQRADQLRRNGLRGTHGEMLVLRHHLADLGVGLEIAEAPSVVPPPGQSQRGL